MDLSNSLSFLEQLAAHNEKEWMDANRDWYETCKVEFRAFVEEMILRLSSMDPNFTGLSVKDCVFRINRDIRFSKSKAPYKSNFAALFSEGGKKSLFAGYYFHLQPGNESFVGGGLYAPPGDTLRKVRQEIDYNASELKSIVTGSEFVNAYGSIQGEKLRSSPRGYSSDHPNIEFLRLKSYVALHPLTDEEASSLDISGKCEYYFRILKPFIDYLNVAIS